MAPSYNVSVTCTRLPPFSGLDGPGTEQAPTPKSKFEEGTMADKKVDRNVRSSGGPMTPTESMEVALSHRGTVNMADTAHDKGKSALLDKFRAREERYRRDQSLQARAEAAASNPSEPEEEPAEEESPAEQLPADEAPVEEATP